MRGISSGELVHDISFSVRSGEILGVVALEGQGQDRLFALLSGDRRPTTGEIIVDGRTRTFRSPYDAVRDGVVLVPGDRLLALLPDLSVRKNLAMPLFNRIRQWFYIPSNEKMQTLTSSQGERFRFRGSGVDVENGSLGSGPMCGQASTELQLLA